MQRNGRSPATPRWAALFALGLLLARSGFTAWLALAVTGTCILGASVLAIFLAHRGKLEALSGVPLAASSALAFGVGVLVALAASTRTFRRDEDEGVRGLLRARGVSATEYLAARIAGLATVLAALVGGGSAVVGVIATLATRGRSSALHTAQASLAAVVFSLVFAVTFAPVAMATLAARGRGGGYLALLAVLVAPELLAPAFDRLIAHRWLDVCSIPGALLALRTSLAPVGVDPFMLGRSLSALLAITLAALLVVRAELARSRRTPRAGRSPSDRPRT